MREALYDLAKPVLSAALIVAVVSGIMNLLGTAYYWGYLNGWGLSEALFPAQPGWLSLRGAVSLLFFSGRAILWIAMIFLLLLVIPRLKRKMWAQKLAKKIKSSPFFVEVWSFVAICSLLIAFASAWALEKRRSAGEDDAHDQRSKMKKEDGKQILKMSQGNNLKGHLVLCSESHCAMFSSDTLRIVRTADIEQIVQIIEP